jgi:hypothetical protein
MIWTQHQAGCFFAATGTVQLHKCRCVCVYVSQTPPCGVRYLPNGSLVTLEALGSRVPGPHNQQESIEGVCVGPSQVILLLFAGLHGNTSRLVFSQLVHNRKIKRRREDSFNAEKLEVGPSLRWAQAALWPCSNLTAI